MNKADVLKIVREEFNELLADPATALDERVRVAARLEAVLFRCNDYRGFNFLGWIRDGGFEKWEASGKPFPNTPYLGDQTRRVYY